MRENLTWICNSKDSLSKEKIRQCMTIYDVFQGKSRVKNVIAQYLYPFIYRGKNYWKVTGSDPVQRGD